jgi:ferredoxin
MDFMKAFVNKKNCIFRGMCGGVCPDIFFSDYDGKSVALDIEIELELLDLAKYAESICPASAITTI